MDRIARIRRVDRGRKAESDRWRRWRCSAGSVTAGAGAGENFSAADCRCCTLARRSACRDGFALARGGHRGVGSRGRRRRPLHPRLDIGCDCTHIVLGNAREIVRDRRHRTCGNPVTRLMAASQIVVQRIRAPRHRRGRCFGQRRCMPALGFASAEILPLVFGAQRVARRVARATMREAFDQIGAAIPGCALRRVGAIDARFEIKCFPHGDRGSEARRRPKPVRRSLGADGVAGHDEGVDCRDVQRIHAREMIVWKCGIEMPPGAIDAIVHGAQKILAAPESDTGIRIGRDVGRMDRAEGRRQRQSAGEWLASGLGVAGTAVADGGELRALGHDGGVEQSSLGRCRCGNDQRSIDRSNRRKNAQ